MKQAVEGANLNNYDLMKATVHVYTNISECNVQVRICHILSVQ